MKPLRTHGIIELTPLERIEHREKYVALSCQDNCGNTSYYLLLDGRAACRKCGFSFALTEFLEEIKKPALGDVQ